MSSSILHPELLALFAEKYGSPPGPGRWRRSCRDPRFEVRRWPACCV